MVVVWSFFVVSDWKKNFCGTVFYGFLPDENRLRKRKKHEIDLNSMVIGGKAIAF